MPKPAIAETDLYDPIKRLLEGQGYEVKGEVGAADIVACREAHPPVIVELKTSFSLSLFHQAIERLRITDLVYIAVPRKPGARFAASVSNNLALCRRLGLGLITVDLRKGRTNVLLDPGAYRPRKSAVKNGRLLLEFTRRVGDPNPGGATRKGLVTAYRQDALRCLSFLRANGPTKASEISHQTSVEKARQIMADDHYGWFERVNPPEAERVRLIFERYLGARNIFALKDWLEKNGVSTKHWTSRTGREHGGVSFTRGALAHILNNRIYLGEIVHRDNVYAGQHEPIIDRKLFDAVQDKLAGRTPHRDEIETRGRRAPLLGKLFDDKGRPLTAAHANKKGVRYFYYVSTVDTSHATRRALRVSAPRLERCVVETVTPLLGTGWRVDPDVDRVVFETVRKVTVAAKKITISVTGKQIEPDNQSGAIREGKGWRIVAPNDLARPASSRGILGAADDSAPRIDRALLRAVALSRRWAQRLASGEVASIQALADQEGLCPIYTGQLLPLGYLSPDLVAQIVEGRQPPRITLATLLDASLPLDFAGQRALFKTFA